MIDANPNSTFRHLPLTLEQDTEIRHYIKRKSQKGEPWDTPELATMLRDMLDPPPNDDEEPEADLLAFGPADILEFAQTHLHTGRTIAGIERVRGSSAGGDTALDKGFGDLSGVLWRLHRQPT